MQKDISPTFSKSMQMNCMERGTPVISHKDRQNAPYKTRGKDIV